ncbi:fizzy-related protein homolog [Paramacrobiotus metropolitanus]|uniref:fizzy-related protein homolog n=1 Tax=Paramacrobiotus metropolitanus TaxID=2943436 RepID=UPI002446566B|nr:fizzy-related protein homolog [Paramacrobiotus metropolitanus]
MDDAISNNQESERPADMEMITPPSSPTFRRKKAFTSPVKSPDRYIPQREPRRWRIAYTCRYDEQTRISTNAASTSRDDSKDGFGASQQLYQRLLRNEIMGADMPDAMDDTYGQENCPSSGAILQHTGNGISAVSTSSSSLHSSSTIGIAPLTPTKSSKRNVFTYSPKKPSDRLLASTSPFSLSPLSEKSCQMLRQPRKVGRKIPKVPYKVLDAPELQDDFYLNLVDWSHSNVLAVGLGTSVYLWSASNSSVTRLCDFHNDNNTITSVSWSERGNLVAVGTNRGQIQIWDAVHQERTSSLSTHTARVGALAWNSDVLASGSRDRIIWLNDMRTPPLFARRKFNGHKQEVCGLKWSPDHMYLASGGNDNKLLVWAHNAGTESQPVQTYTDHQAAVKAIAWSPHHHGLLASGGGTADRYIRFWNTLTGQALQAVDTGSQVCNLAWSKHASELVSTHGYSQNQILLWKYPSLTQIAKLIGHTYRVLYLAMSPDGESIVTGAGDETLRFWNIFSKSRSTRERRSSLDLLNAFR